MVGVERGMGWKEVWGGRKDRVDGRMGWKDGWDGRRDWLEVDTPWGSFSSVLDRDPSELA